MADFTFYKARYQFELTGLKARDLPELVGVIKDVDESAIFNHIYHALLDYHFLPPEYPNDFAYWIADVLHEPALAERLSDLDLRELNDPESLRQKIIKTIGDYMTMYDVSGRARIGQEFHFIRCISVVFPTKTVARNLNDMLEIIKESDDLDSIFYYFIASRLLGGMHYKALSDWVLKEDSQELMGKLDNLYPYGFANLHAMKLEIVKILEEYFWEHL